MSPALQKSYVYGATIEKKYVYDTGLKVNIQKKKNFIIMINNMYVSCSSNLYSQVDPQQVLIIDRDLLHRLILLANIPDHDRKVLP